jgi:hypothetical protein
MLNASCEALTLANCVDMYTVASTQDAEESPQTYIMFTYSLSTLIAIYAFAVVKQQSVKLLSVMHVRPKYFCLQAVLLVVGLQRSVILTVFLSFQLPCEPPLHIESTVDRKSHVITLYRPIRYCNKL